ncbi:acylphosphatase [Candidatus Pyrohabitans sp.]
MEAQIKRYNVVIHGRVQDIGFRNMVVQMANFLRLKGYVFNDVDGSVKVIVEGLKDTLDAFLEDIVIKTGNIGAEITSLDKKEVSFDFDLPPKFVKIPTTELEEIGRKLDVGIDKLRSIDGKLDKLDKLETLDTLAEGQDTLVDGQNTLVEGQNTLVDGQNTLVEGQNTLVDGQNTLVEGQNTLVKRLDTLVEGQEGMRSTQEKMLKVLEKIEGKL